MLVRKAEIDEWEDAMALAWRVFEKFDAKDYTEEGVNSFLNFISDNGLYKMFITGEYKLFVAESGGKIVGVSSLRMRNHISLLFVDESFHHIGVGRKLIDFMIDYLHNEEKLDYCTVNSAPYAIGFYHKLGFEDLGKEQENEGIKFVPMRKWFL